MIKKIGACILSLAMMVSTVKVIANAGLDGGQFLLVNKLNGKFLSLGKRCDL